MRTVPRRISICNQVPQTLRPVLEGVFRPEQDLVGLEFKHPAIRLLSQFVQPMRGFKCVCHVCHCRVVVLCVLAHALAYAMYIYNGLRLLYNVDAKGNQEMAKNEHIDDVDFEYLEQLANDRDEAERSGLFEDERIYDCLESPASQLHLTPEQEMTLHRAASSLSELAKETNSTMSGLLRVSGFGA